MSLDDTNFELRELEHLFVDVDVEYFSQSGYGGNRNYTLPGENNPYWDQSVRQIEEYRAFGNDI